MKVKILLFLLFFITFHGFSLDFESINDGEITEDRYLNSKSKVEKLGQKGREKETTERKINKLSKRIKQKGLSGQIYVCKDLKKYGEHILKPIADCIYFSGKQNEIVIELIKRGKISKRDIVSGINLRTVLHSCMQILRPVYKTLNIGDFDTLDGIYERGNIRLLVKNGKVKTVITNNGVETIKIERKTDNNLFGINKLNNSCIEDTIYITVEVGQNSITAKLSSGMLNVISANIPIGYSSNIELIKLDEKKSKSINELPFYLSEYYIWKGIKEYKNPVEYLKAIVSDNKKAILFVEEGFKISEKQK